MTYLALDSGTWGIDGPDFLLLYLTLAGVAVVVSLVLRQRALAGEDAGSAASHLGPYEVAYLNGGENQAVVAATTALHQQGVLGTTGYKKLTAQHTLPASAHPLEQAILKAVVSGNATSGNRLRYEHRVQQALATIAQSLSRTGLLVSPDAARRARRASWLLLAVLVLGLVRLAAGFANGRPIGFLVLAVIAVAVIEVVLVARSVPTVTARAKESLSAIRLQNSHLSPRSNPAWETYGPHSAAMGIALFGTAALWSADPAFASELDIEQHRAASGNSSSGCGSTTYGSSDSGSSSSCGSSSSSSCGGGGGCGG